MGGELNNYLLMALQITMVYITPILTTTLEANSTFQKIWHFWSGSLEQGFAKFEAILTSATFFWSVLFARHVQWLTFSHHDVKVRCYHHIKIIFLLLKGGW